MCMDESAEFIIYNFLLGEKDFNFEASYDNLKPILKNLERSDLRQFIGNLVGKGLIIQKHKNYIVK